MKIVKVDFIMVYQNCIVIISGSVLLIVIEYSLTKEAL